MPMTPRRRVLALITPIFLLAAAFALPAAARGASHPYFDDQGTLTWHHDLASARRAAEREGKLIFIEYGRRICTQCKLLCARILPHPSVRGRIRRVAVGLVAECDRPEPAVRSLFRRHLQNARMLPFVAFVTPDGRWVTGYAGHTTVSQFSRHLALAERALQRVEAPKAPARTRVYKPACPPKPAPTPPPTPSDCRPLTSDGGACPDGECDAEHDPHIKFRPPPIFTSRQRCRPCPPQTPPEPDPSPSEPVADAPKPGFGRFPSPCPLPDAPTSADLAERPPAAPAHARRVASGSPDGAPQRALPAPKVRPSRPYPGARRRPMTGYGDPDGEPGRVPVHERFASPTQSAREAALAAAERGAWGEVIRHTRVGARTDPDLRVLNHRAHAWAHGQLASAVRSLREQRYADASRAIAAVQRAMQGEPEAIDANRGAEAIELMQDMQDLQHLSEESAVRRVVRRNAYEKMRGSRWAPLFSDCPVPSRALSSR
jgi:hypothetical protein